MRIAQLLTGVGDGAARYCLLLTRELARRGHQVILCDFGGPLPADIELPGVRRIVSQMHRDFGELRRVHGLLAGAGVEVVHTHSSRANTFGVLMRLLWRVPVVATAHSRHLQIHWALNDRVIAPSESTAAYHRRVNLVRRGRLVVVPNFVDVGDFPATTPERRRRARDALGIADDAFVIGCVGSIIARKNQSGLVAALAMLRSRGIAGRLVLVGDGSEEEGRRVASAAASAGLSEAVIVTGRRDDIRDLLPGFDVYAQASRKEEMPLSILEAMATGLPVVATAVGGIPEMVEDGRSGYLVAEGDMAALAAHLAALHADPGLRAAMRKRAVERVWYELSPGQVVPRVEQVLADAAALRRPRGQARE